MNVMTNGTPTTRIGRLERTIPPAPCETCQGQSWRVVIGPEATPPATCPDCGREVHTLHIAIDDNAPE